MINYRILFLVPKKKYSLLVPNKFKILFLVPKMLSKSHYFIV